MAGTKGEEAIVVGCEEIEGRKSVYDDKEARLAKREKVGGDEAAGCTNLGTKVQSQSMICDEGEEGLELKEKIDRLRGWLEDDRKRLRKKDVEDVICYFNVDEIISLALKSGRATRKAFDGYAYVEESHFVPSSGKVLRLLKLMLQSGVEKLKEVDLFILHQNFPNLPFALLLLSALDSHSLFDKEDERVMVYKLCCSLPWKLFAHVMYHKTKLPQFKRIEEEESNDECTILKKAAESCEICCGKGKHSGVYGYHCSFWDSVPSGLTIGPKHYAGCRDCGMMVNREDFVGCWCGCRVRKAVPFSTLWN